MSGRERGNNECEREREFLGQFPGIGKQRGGGIGPGAQKEFGFS